jgi:hypothetical protein
LESTVSIFVTVLTTFALSSQETLNKYGDSSIEAAICYYEYGNALFRAARLQQNEEEPEETSDARSKAAEEAQKRAEALVDSKPAAKDANDEKEDKETPSNGKEELEEEEEEEEGEGADDEDDVQLALEMMETAWSVFDKHVQDLKDQKKSHTQWVLDQLPRTLLGIGDVLTDLQRHADAVDVYTRALDHRESALRVIPNEELTLSHLKRRRHMVEANVLVAEALLECPDGQDVVTTETGDVLATAAERVDYARGYYDKARDELQETVYLMGRMAESNQNLGTEKEDVCFLATLLMGVGTTLAEYDERQTAAASTNELHPNKRQKI